jgi:hypothetical protein
MVCELLVRLQALLESTDRHRYRGMFHPADRAPCGNRNRNDNRRYRRSAHSSLQVGPRTRFASWPTTTMISPRPRTRSAKLGRAAGCCRSCGSPAGQRSGYDVAPLKELSGPVGFQEHGDECKPSLVHETDCVTVLWAGVKNTIK